MCHVIHRYEDLLVGPKSGVAPADGAVIGADFVVSIEGKVRRRRPAGRPTPPRDG